jgi:hypothetical protein
VTSDAIRRENERPGTRSWLLDRVELEPDCPFRSPSIEGYCSRASVRAGERIGFHLSAHAPTTVTIDLYRTGWYGGDGARQVLSLGPLAVDAQPVPEAIAGRARECRWPETAAIAIPPEWLSGVYLGKLTTAAGLQSYLIFIVADDRRADLLCKCSDTTWQAYNRWPRWSSLYDGGGTIWWSGPGAEVGFDRPYGKYCSVLDASFTAGAGTREWHDAPLTTGSGEYLLWEFPTVFWLESQGYDVSYLSCLDLHRGARGLRRAAGLLSLGHDEYWSEEMRRHLQAAIADGLSVAFLSGNTCFYRIALNASSDGRADRRFSRADIYAARDPRMAEAFPGAGDFSGGSGADAELMGAGNVYPCAGGGDWICETPAHWLYHGTGLRRGDCIPGLIGWEWHGGPAAIPGLEVVATGPTEGTRGSGAYAATVYPGPYGNVVFNAATIWWGDGLAAPPGYRSPSVYTTPRGPDARVQRMTGNLIARMLAAGRDRHPRSAVARA